VTEPISTAALLAFASSSLDNLTSTSHGMVAGILLC